MTTLSVPCSTSFQESFSKHQYNTHPALLAAKESIQVRRRERAVFTHAAAIDRQPILTKIFIPNEQQVC
jgi:hypothetical protein